MNVHGMRTGRDVVKVRFHPQAEATVLDVDIPDVCANTVQEGDMRITSDPDVIDWCFSYIHT